MIIPALLLAVPAALVLKQPDLGTALILILITGDADFRRRTELADAGSPDARGGARGARRMALSEALPERRLVSFLNPQSDPLGTGYHIIQSEIAIGSGGAWGKGFLKGTQARLNFLPEQTTDFIFAVFAEEFGFFGSIVLLGLYTRR